MYIFTCIAVECHVLDPDVDGFSSNLFAFLIYYFEVGGASLVVVVGFTVDVNCTGYMTTLFFHSIF